MHGYAGQMIAVEKPPPGPGRVVLKAAAFAIGLGLCCGWSIEFTRGPLGLSTLWVASGVLCGFLLTSRRRQWPAYILGTFLVSVLANFLLRGVGVLGLALSVANVLDAWIVAEIVSRRMGDVSQMQQIGRSIWTATLSTLLACSISASIAALARSLSASSPGGFEVLFATWLASHGLGMAIFAPLTIIARVEGQRLFGKPGKRLELAITLALVAATCLAVFTQNRYGTAFMVFPPLLVCVLPHRFSGFVPAMAMIAVIATTATADGLGPFVLDGEFTDFQRTMLLQVFIASTCLLAFSMAVTLTERKLFAHRATQSEQEYRMLADYSRDLVVRLVADGTRRYVSPSATELLGWSREELGSSRWDLVHPDDVELLRAALIGLFRDGGDTTLIFRTLHRDGHYLWLEANARRVPGLRAGDPPEVIYAGRDVSKRIEAEQALERLARQDMLTGLANRRSFEERLDVAIARSQRTASPIALLYLDVDHFKQINDSQGHAAGDLVLRQFAKQLTDCVRKTDFPARLGGDEFVVLVEDLDARQAPEAIAQKLVARLQEPFIVDGKSLRVTTSIGVAYCARPPPDQDKLMRIADEALYAAKAAGRNTWRTVDWQSDRDPSPGPGD